MTIRVSVANEDERPGAKVQVGVYSQDPSGQAYDKQTGRVVLNSGERTEQYVHQGQYLIVKELN